MPRTKQYGHWKSLVGEFNPTDYFGFIYLVYCRETKRYYIGKKQTVSQNRIKVKGSTRKKLVTKESDWITYTTSSDHIKKDLESFGKDKFDFYIVGLYKTKGGLRYAECNLLHKLDANIIRIDEDTRLFYNLAIDAIRFVPAEFDPDTEKRIRKIMKENPCEPVTKINTTSRKRA